MRRIALLSYAMLSACIPSPAEIPFESREGVDMSHEVGNDVQDAGHGDQGAEDLGAADVGCRCAAEATCREGVCVCDDGFEGDGATCTAIKECESDEGGCRCEDIAGAVACRCSPGYTGDGTSCTPEPRLVLNVQRLSITLSDNTPVRVQLPWAAPNAVPFATKRISGTTSQADQVVDVYLVDGGKAVEAVRAGTGGEVVVEVEVAEFNPDFAVVRTGTFAMADEAAVASVGLTPELNTVETAFVLATAVADADVADAADSFMTVRVKDEATIEISRTEIQGSLAGHWHIVEAVNDAFAVYRVDFGDLDALTATQETAMVPMNRGAIIFSHEVESSATPGEALVDCWRTSDTEVRCERGADDVKAKDLEIQLIDFGASVQVRRADIELGTNVSTVLAPPVDPARTLLLGISVTNIGEARTTAGPDAHAGYATSRISERGDSVNSERGSNADTLQRKLSIVEF